MKTILPQTLFELLEIAIADLKYCYNSKAYVVDFETYYSLDDREKNPNKNNNLCVVCLAGAVTAQTINGGSLGKFSLGFPELWYEKKYISAKDRNALRALDCLRQGQIYEAACFLYSKSKIIYIDNNSFKFKKAWFDKIVKSEFEIEYESYDETTWCYDESDFKELISELSRLKRYLRKVGI